MFTSTFILYLCFVCNEHIVVIFNNILIFKVPFLNLIQFKVWKGHFFNNIIFSTCVLESPLKIESLRKCLIHLSTVVSVTFFSL